MSTFQPPEYLTDELVEIALQQGLKCKNIHVRNVAYSAGSSGGDNYCSDIIRAIVTFSRGGAVKTDTTLIIKCITPSPSRDLLVKLGVFDTEENMFLRILPRIEGILQKSISPKCYYTCLRPAKTFFMDDLGSFGYKIADRTKKLDFIHAEVVLKQLGRFHAASMVLAEKLPQEARRVSKPPLFPANKEDLNEIHFSLFSKTFESFISLTADMPKFESIAWKLKKFKDTFLEIITNTYNNTDDKLKVINHGDFWMNNIMFKYSGNKPIPVDVKFIDFQFSYYASPGIDINYFLSTSCRVDVLENHRTDLLRAYYETFSETLQKAKYSPIPTYEDIKYEVFRKEFYGFMAFATLSPVMSMDSELSSDNTLTNVGSAEKQRDMFKAKVFRELSDFCLDRYDKLGIFDL